MRPLFLSSKNNQYAISVARQKQTRAETLVQKARGRHSRHFGRRQRPDGDACRHEKSCGESPVRRRPHLIEAYTYRLSAHTTFSDDPTKYRQDEEVEQWQVKDPIRRMKAYLTKRESGAGDDSA